MVEPLISLNHARAVLGALKGVKRISYPALVRLVQKEGLPVTPNPFNPGAWAFRESDILTWFQAYTTPAVSPLKGPGRPGARR
ncbi:MAG: hypothetical protein P4L36_13130 [Holophaga sp.]|nr:hypothetical protein [Holophaga sp.]